MVKHGQFCPGKMSEIVLSRVNNFVSGVVMGALLCNEIKNQKSKIELSEQMYFTLTQIVTFSASITPSNKFLKSWKYLWTFSTSRYYILNISGMDSIVDIEIEGKEHLGPH